MKNSMIPEWAKLLDSWRENAGWSVAEYGRRVNQNPNEPEVSLDSIRAYLRGRVDQPRGDTLDRLARPFGKTKFDLQQVVPLTNAVRSRTFPLFRMNELGTLDVNEIKGLTDWKGPTVIADSAMTNDDIFAIEIIDNSCSPRINKGDVIYCQPVNDGDLINPDQFVVGRINGHAAGICGRFKLMNPVDRSAFSIVPENSNFPTYTNDPTNPVTVLGTVKYRRESF